MEILYVLLVLLIATRAFGELAVRVGQPALVGELLAGVGLGIVVMHNQETFPVLSDLPENPVFKAITDLGIFFLMLMAGLELRPRKLAEASRHAVVVAVGGLVLPLGLGDVAQQVMGFGGGLVELEGLLGAHRRPAQVALRNEVPAPVEVRGQLAHRLELVFHRTRVSTWPTPAVKPRVIPRACSVAAPCPSPSR